MTQGNPLMMDGDGELAWTGKNECKLFLAYYCSFWNEEGEGGIAIHEFDIDGRHLNLRYVSMKRLDRRDPIGIITREVECWANSVNGYHPGPIAVLEFDVEFAAGKYARLVRNDFGDGVLLPRELRFDQTKSGRVTLDFKLTVL